MSSPLCPSLLNSGGVIGLASDLARLYARWSAPATQWPALSSAGTTLSLHRPRGRKAPSVSGTAPPLLLGRRAAGAAPERCALESGGDQCLAVHLLLASNGSIGVDTAERIFATAAVAVNRSHPAMPMRPDWPSRSARVWCGAEPLVRCGGSTTLQWEASPARAAPEGEQRASRALVRPAPYRAACGIAAEGPLLIHFNGPAKFLLGGKEVTRWLG